MADISSISKCHLCGKTGGKHADFCPGDFVGLEDWAEEPILAQTKLERMKSLVGRQTIGIQQVIFRIWGTGETISNHFEFITETPFRLLKIWATGPESTVIHSLKIAGEEQFVMPIPLSVVNENPPRFNVVKARFDRYEILHTLLQNFGPDGLAFPSCDRTSIIRLEFEGNIEGLILGGIESVGL